MLSSLALLVLGTGGAGAQDRVTVDSVAAAAGQMVSVPIRVTTSSPLTALQLDVTFDPALCSRIENQTVQPGEGATLGPPRIVDPDEVAHCPDAGRVSVVLVDLVLREADGSRIIPPGDHVAAEWSFFIRADAPPGSFLLTPHVAAARNGPRRIDLATSTGMLTIRPAGNGCTGDCDGGGTVRINELVLGVNIALGQAPLDGCPSFDPSGNGRVDINELVMGVNNSLGGCP